MQSRLQRLFNVRKAEWNLVTKLFWFQFFQGTGIAFFFTASFTRFLEKNPASELAWVILISSPLLFITGWFFNKGEQRFNLAYLGKLTVFFMAGSIVLFYFTSNELNSHWYYYLMFAWYYVLYLISNLGFWSIASGLFDVRQSKRLFSVISAGDIPAKFIGYTIAYFFVKTIGTVNMLWPSFVFMLCSFPFLYQLSKSGVIKTHAHHHEIEETDILHRRSFRQIIKKFTVNPLIRSIALLSFFISTCLIIINFAFYKEVKEANHDNKYVTNFIFLFLAFSQIIALVVKLIFTGRLINSLGVKKALYITPLVLLSLLAVILTIENTMGKHIIVIYTFGVAAIAVEILRNTLNSPVFLTVMQPLVPHERAKAHNIVKGIMDPFAFLFSGVLLLLLLKIQDISTLLIICYALLLITIFWIFTIKWVDISYRQTLIQTISSRFFSQDEFSLSNEDIQKQIQKKIAEGNELEVINILQMLNTRISSVNNELIFSLLDHPSDQVKIETIHLIDGKNVKGAEEKLEVLANHSNSKQVRFFALQILCKHDIHQKFQKYFIDNSDPEIRAAAISGMLLSKNQNTVLEAEKIVSTYINSNDEQSKNTAINILNEVKDSYCHSEHLLLLNETGEIKSSALKIIGKAANTELLNFTIKHLNEYRRIVLDTLQAAGEKSISVIQSYLQSGECTETNKEKLILLIGKIGGVHSHKALFNLLNQNPKDAALIAKALHRSRYRCTPETEKLLEKIAFEFIVYGVELLNMQKLLQPDMSDYKILVSSLNIELTEIRNVILSLFGCLYDHTKFFKVRQGLDMKKKETIANAMEVIETTVRKDLASHFNNLYEPTDIEHRCSVLKFLLHESVIPRVEDIIFNILSEKPVSYNSWTKACSMYVSKKIQVEFNRDLFKQYSGSQNRLLQETAAYAVLND